MKFLLDTHVWIWSVTEPERLSRRARTALTRANVELWLSPVSLWEVLLLAERGRITLQGGGRAWIDAALARTPFRDAPLTREVAIVSRTLALPHEDPADRFLAATAAVHDLVLVTADEKLLGAKGFRTLKAD